MSTSHQLQTLTASELEQVEGGVGLLADFANALVAAGTAVVRGVAKAIECAVNAGPL